MPSDAFAHLPSWPPASSGPGWPKFTATSSPLQVGSSETGALKVATVPFGQRVPVPQTDSKSEKSETEEEDEGEEEEEDSFCHFSFFWTAYLSIKQPVTAHDPLHPKVPSRH